ncbi:hypothetical protein Lspi_0228 [Legionella spiritensis]|uniref:Uncharacterized protein n=1 Tax=Legionella spiritensis TaxID=452 RepID=A0A0W0ZAJ6_LEGSP|nr:hypothetical protein Lspi_0228 [Legionella spiritensis]SNV34993.1 Uncharacterised protein [Legionella spiritensis]
MCSLFKAGQPERSTARHPLDETAGFFACNFKPHRQDSGLLLNRRVVYTLFGVMLRNNDRPVYNDDLSGRTYV